MKILRKVSNGGLLLQRSLKLRRLRSFNGTVETVLNWGISSKGLSESFCENNKFINKPSAVAIASNKLSSLQVMDHHGIPVPVFVRTKEEASDLLINGKCKVVCRTLLSASSGRGIVIARSVDDLVDAPLYTIYIKKSAEFRVHVVNGSVILVQKKKRLTSESMALRGISRELVSPLIRNLDNGWVYSASLSIDEDLLDRLCITSVRAVESLGLDFGAVDLIINKEGGEYVLEVNTAPGLCDVSLRAYSEAFNQYT